MMNIDNLLCLILHIVHKAWSCQAIWHFRLPTLNFLFLFNTIKFKIFLDNISEIGDFYWERVNDNTTYRVNSSEIDIEDQEEKFNNKCNKKMKKRPVQIFRQCLTPTRFKFICASNFWQLNSQNFNKWPMETRLKTRLQRKITKFCLQLCFKNL